MQSADIVWMFWLETKSNYMDACQAYDNIFCVPQIILLLRKYHTHTFDYVNTTILPTVKKKSRVDQGQRE